ncbi:MAG: HAD hydrolase-like protein [Rhodanobacter sp.]
MFDLDGTLIDSEAGIFACVRHALAMMQVIEPDRDTLRGWIGPPLQHSFAPLLDHDETRIRIAIAHYHERFSEVGWREHRVYPDIDVLIDGLRAAGHQLAVVTGKPKIHALPIVENLPFAAAFERVYGPDPDSPNSEKASMVAAALSDFGYAPEHAVMVGDRRFDMEGAVANRVRGIGVLWGFGHRDELQRAGATSIVATPEELAQLLMA